MILLPLLAQATKPGPDPEQLQRLHYALILILAIGIVGILLILAMLAAWRNFHKRIAELEAERDERREQEPHPDAWREAGDRVAIEPSPHAHGNNEDDTDLYGKDWEPGDDDDNPDDDKGW